MYSGDEFYDDDITSGVQPHQPVPGLDTPNARPQTQPVRSTECSHDQVERDDDGLDRRFFVCLDCGQEVSLTEPDEDGQSFWEVN